MSINGIPLSGLAPRLVEQCPDAVIFADKTGTIQVWNPAAQRIFGFQASDALGKNLNIIIPERLRDAHWRGFDHALAERTTKYGGQALPTKAVRADGANIYVELSFAIILDDQGQALGALAQARDITERFEKERAARKHLKELEQQLAGKP